MKDRMTGMTQLAAAALLASGPAWSQEATREPIAEPAAPAAEVGDAEHRALSFELGVGAEYDTNVAVLELDTNAGAGDAALLLDFGMSYAPERRGTVGFQAGYDFSQTSHEDFDAFDVRIHRGSATLSFDTDGIDSGIMLQHAKAELDGNEFLTLTQFSPYLSKLVGNRLFLRFAYASTDKDFAGNPGRDADSDSLSSDIFVFINGLQTYVVLGARIDDESAVDPQFDYEGHRLRAQLSRRFDVGDKQWTFKTGLRYETRDYSAPTPSIGMRRADDRYQFETTLDVPIGERLTATFAYKHADNRSNLPSVDFDENVYSVSFRAAL